MGGIGIVIVTYNSAGDIGPCLDAAVATGAEVVVVDNASSDETLSRVNARNAVVIANRDNRGFAAAVNQGVRAIAAEYVLLLNPDAVLQSGLEALRDACAAPGAGAAGGKLLDIRGQIQAGFTVRRLPTPLVLALEILLVNRLWPRNPANWHYRCYDFAYDKPAEVEQPAGAFLMFRRRVWEELGGFDERFYPIWFEDVDFCKRLRDRGYSVYYEPAAGAVHRGGHSIQKILLEERQLYWYRSLLKYGFKHFRTGVSRLLCLAVIIGSCLRMTMGIVLQRSLRPVQVYAPVIGLASRYLLFGPSNKGIPSFS
jgi:N-acetylglucosaminyl-diphospho-decaprenol L-rhamnosyltransferase